MQADKKFFEDFQMSDEDKRIIKERLIAYENGKDKGVSALDASGRIKEKLKAKIR